MAALRFCSSVVGCGVRALPRAGNNSLRRPSWKSRSRRSTSRRTAIPRCDPGPPSSDQTAAKRRCGSMAHRTLALPPRAPPSPAIRAARLAISRKTGRQARGTLRRGENGLSSRSARSHSKV
eukprot:9072120-Alexandrium_andersonii.AAC.1